MAKELRRGNICPYTRSSSTPAGSNCKESCALWDDVNKCCYEVTKVTTLIGIKDYMLFLTQAIQRIAMEASDGDRQADTDES